jgi:hypothetical protein
MITRIAKRLALAVGVAVMATSALATDLPPGATLDPVPLAPMPSGLTLEGTYARDFDVSWTVFPFTRHMTGTITQNVYRRADNTLIFHYYVHNDSSSFGAVTRFAASNFGTFDTNVFLSNSGFCFNCDSADRATRDIFGTGIAFYYDLGITAGDNSRSMVVSTNATSYRVSNGRLVPIGSGRVSISTGDHSQSLYGFAYPVVDSTPPIATLTEPTGLEHSCPPVTFTGRVYDTAGFDSYKLEYATAANGPWTLIAEVEDDVNPVGTLAVWPANVPEGYYFVRLTALNTAELSTTVTNVIYIDRAMSPVVLRSPAAPSPNPQILGGYVCLDGTVWDTGGSNYSIQYRSLPSGVFADVVSGTPSYPGQIITDGLGSWLTSSGPTAVPDGLYQLRVTATDGCGNTDSETRDIMIDNTRPIAFISSPAACGYMNGVINVVGTVTDANLSGWSLSYTGGDSPGWTTIASGNGPVINASLGQWDTSRLRNCAYTLRLHAGDSSAVSCGATTNQTEHYISVNIGCASDFNHDNVANSQDFFDFLTAFFAGCP